MKRSSDGDGDEPSATAASEDQKMKKVKTKEEETDEEEDMESGFRNLDNNLLFEVLKHADARTLAVASCVSRQWHDTARDERLWELLCMRQWPSFGCGHRQLRSVVLALGGFCRLHALYIYIRRHVLGPDKPLRQLHQRDQVAHLRRRDDRHVWGL